ncbi:MAG: acyl carrier protein [bacterium]|nr:acyl carrier protein [bacterium]MDO5462549.1 acyl carrier protein [bacterium]
MIQRLEQCFSEALRQPMPTTFATATFEALPGWDSIAHLSLLLAVEKAFHIAFTSKEMVTMRDVPTMLAIVEERSHA